MHSFPQFTHSTRRGKFYREWAIFWGAVFLGGNFPWEQFSGGGGNVLGGNFPPWQLSGGQFSSEAIVRTPLEICHIFRTFLSQMFVQVRTFRNKNSCN